MAWRTLQAMLRALRILPPPRYSTWISIRNNHFDPWELTLYWQAADLKVASEASVIENQKHTELIGSHLVRSFESPLSRAAYSLQCFCFWIFASKLALCSSRRKAWRKWAWTWELPPVRTFQKGIETSWFCVFGSIARCWICCIRI